MSSSRALHTQILHLSCLAALAAGQAVLLALGDRTLDLDAKITVDGWGSITPTGEKKEETDDTALPFPGVKLDGKEGIQYLNMWAAFTLFFPSFLYIYSQSDCRSFDSCELVQIISTASIG